MLSEDINASMNYSVMTTRSVIKNAANICSVLRGGCGEWASRRGKALKINMTNWQIICSIRTAEQVHPASQAVPHGDTLTSQKPRAWWEIPCLHDSDLEQCAIGYGGEKIWYSPWCSLKFDCSLHPLAFPFFSLTLSPSISVLLALS